MSLRIPVPVSLACREPRQWQKVVWTWLTVFDSDPLASTAPGRPDGTRAEPPRQRPDPPLHPAKPAPPPPGAAHALGDTQQVAGKSTPLVLLRFQLLNARAPPDAAVCWLQGNLLLRRALGSRQDSTLTRRSIIHSSLPCSGTAPVPSSRQQGPTASVRDRPWGCQVMRGPVADLATRLS